MLAIGGFLARRALLLVPLLIAVSFLCFMLVRLGGQDPVAMLAGPTATAAEIETIRRTLALDQPLWAQFLAWLGKVAQGDLGRSWVSNRPVLTEVLDRAPATFELLLYGERHIDEPGLSVPHPRMHLRAFVLDPLAEIAPGLVVPGLGPLAVWRARIVDPPIERLA